MAGDRIDKLMNLWAASLLCHDDSLPFADHDDLYRTIDGIPHGKVAWQSFTMRYNGN